MGCSRVRVHRHSLIDSEPLFLRPEKDGTPRTAIREVPLYSQFTHPFFLRDARCFMENTPLNDDRQDESPKKQISPRLRGIPFGLLLRCRDAIEEMGVSPNTWKRWVDAGLDIIEPGTECPYVISDKLIAFVVSYSAELNGKETPKPPPKKRKPG